MESDANTMSKNWRDLEILTGILLFIIGGIFLFLLIQIATENIETFQKTPKLYNSGVSVLSIIWAYHTFLVLSFMLTVGGVLLIIEKRTGWVLSLISTTVIALFLFMPIFQIDLNRDKYLWLIYLFEVVFILIVFLLVNKPFRMKYLFTKKEKIGIFAFALILLLDTFL